MSKSDRELLRDVLKMLDDFGGYVPIRSKENQALMAEIRARVLEPEKKLLTSEELAEIKRLGALSWEESARIIENCSLRKNHIL